MKLETVVKTLAAGLIIGSFSVAAYFNPSSVSKVEERSIVENYYNYTFPITPVRLEVSRIFGYCGIFIPPNLILVQHDCKVDGIEIHELIHMKHFYEDPRILFNKTEEARTDLEEYKLRKTLK